MSSAEGQKSPQRVKIFVIAMLLVSLAFAVGLGVLIYFLVRPRGELVGETSLTDPKAALTLNGKVGDSLFFRSDVSVSIMRAALFSDDDHLEHMVDDQLRQSTLTVHASGPSGADHVATCPVYNNRSMTTTITMTAISQSGMLNDCIITLDKPGPWQVHASVAWAPDVKLNSATLETRVDAAKR